jgi:4-amino-4-deoxy-L-arabinose transferase-like glycosyltransferase
MVRKAGPWVAALVPLLLGTALRVRYAVGAEPFVDEPTTLLVAQAIARSGVPTLPSGLFYGNDLPFSYLAGGLVALFGPHLLVLRLFAVAASAGTLGLVTVAGRRLGSAWVGLWAALLLALDPAAIVWGARARGYALLGLLAFVAVWLFYAGTSAPGRDGLRRLGLLVVVLGTFVHPEAALLLPALVLAGGLLRGWRWWLQAGRLAELALASAGVAARYWLQMALAWGQIGGFETIPGSRPPVELAKDWLSGLEGLAPFFLAPERLPWTVLALLALAAVVWSRARRRGETLEGEDRPLVPSAPCLTFSACLWLVPLAMIVLLGSTYQSPRYLTLLLPIFAWVAALGLDGVTGLLVGPGQSHRWRAPAAALGTVALLAAYLPGAVTASGFREKGFQSALEYVGQHWQRGDRVASVAPAYCHLVLGQCDYLTLGLDYEEFVYRGDDGRLVDRWLGSPLVRTAQELGAVLDEVGRLWLVTDESRLRQRFEAAFAQMVWQRMELVAKTDGVMVFVTSERPEPAASHAVDAIWGGEVALTGYDLGWMADRPADPGWGEVMAQPGESLPLTLYWQAAGAVETEYTVFVHLLGPDGQRVAQDDGPPLDGLQPMAHWLAGEGMADRRVLVLPPDLGPGRYRLEVGLYRTTPGGSERLAVTDGTGRELGEALDLDYVRIPAAGEVLPEPERSVQAVLAGDGDEIRLLGYTVAAEVAQPGAKVGLTLYWQAPGPVGADYTVFVHLLDAEDQIRGQGDGLPAHGSYPTSSWDAGEVVVDEHLVAVDSEAAAGSYRLAVGLYLQPSGLRLATYGGEDRLFLDGIRVER